MLVVHSPESEPPAGGVVTGTTVAVTSTTGQTVVPIMTVSVVTLPTGQLVTVGGHEVMVYTVVLVRVLVVRVGASVRVGATLLVGDSVVCPPVVVVLLL